MSAKYARVLRLVALGLAFLTLLKQVAQQFPSHTVEQSMLAVRGTAAILAITIAALCAPSRPLAQLRKLAFVLGLDAVLLCLGLAIILPTDIWEQTAPLVGVLFGAAVFMPWTVRWQTAFVAITLACATVAFLLVIPSAVVDSHTALGVLATLYVMGGLSLLGADLGDHLRRQIEVAEAARRTEDRKRLHEQRLDALGRFAGGIAHQFNNLLGGILTHIEVLRLDKGLASGAESAGALDDVAAAARRGRDLTTELLRFTRADPVALRPTDPGQVLASVAQLARATLGDAATVEVQTPPGGPLPPIAADLDHLVHACTQIVLNARDALRGRRGGGARLVLSAAVEALAGRDPAWPDADPGRYIRFSFADTGPGMDQASLERVFEPFFTTKPMHQAKGLGLATVHRVMREHGGAARVESAVNQGTTVHLLVPLSTEPLPVVPPSPAPASRLPAPQASGATILIVDDEAIVRNSLKRALTRFGHRVLEAGDGATALTALQAADPPVDLAILDLVLPGGGAGVFELLKAVRPELKVIVSSGYSPDGVAAKGLENKVDAFLPKPYELTQLRDVVSKVLASGR